MVLSIHTQDMMDRTSAQSFKVVSVVFKPKRESDGDRDA